MMIKMVLQISAIFMFIESFQVYLYIKSLSKKNHSKITMTLTIMKVYLNVIRKIKFGRYLNFPQYVSANIAPINDMK